MGKRLRCPLHRSVALTSIATRQGRQVRQVRFIFNMRANKPEDYCNLVNGITKEDFQQRHEASGGPDVEATWWDSSIDAQKNPITFKARAPPQVLPEEKYMVLITSRWATLMMATFKVSDWQPPLGLNGRICL